MNVSKTMLLIAACAMTPFASVHAEKADRSKPMEISAAKANVSNGINTAILEGDVRVEQGTLRISAQRGEVRQNEAGQKVGFVTGNPVTVRQKREGCDAYIDAEAERVEFDETKDSLKLITRAKIKTSENEISGEVILYNTVTEAFEVQGAKSQSSDGRVRMVLQPRESGKDPCAKRAAPAAR